MSIGPQNRNEAQTFAFEELRADIQYEILKALKQEGISQSDLAKRLGCSAGCVSQFLDDDANMTLESISKVFLALGRRCVIRSEASEYACRNGEKDSGAEDVFGGWDVEAGLAPADAVHFDFDNDAIEALFDDAIEALFHSTQRNQDFSTTREIVANDNYARAKLQAA